MSRPRVDYNQLAASYDARYRVDSLQYVADTLIEIASRFRDPAILEVGCGTGRWLRDLESLAAKCCGADASFEMLHRSTSHACLVNAHANDLPFRSESFDFVYSVNAFHHFYDPRASIAHAAALLKSSGVLAIVGIDPRTVRTRYFYQYFERARHIDLERYPSFGQQVDWMTEAGLDNIQHRIFHTWSSRFVGRDVFCDPFLNKDSNSLLVLLSDEEYQAGIERIEAAITAAEAENGVITFETAIPFGIVTGTRST